MGKMPMSTIGLRDILERAVRKLEAPGAIDTAHHVKQLCGRCFALQWCQDWAERDVAADLSEALASKSTKHFAAMTEPKRVGDLMRSMSDQPSHSIRRYFCRYFWQRKAKNRDFIGLRKRNSIPSGRHSSRATGGELWPFRAN